MQEGKPGKLISALFRYGRAYLAKQLEPFNIGGGQFWLLFILYQRDGLTQEELSGLLNVDKSTTARFIAKLEKAGYISKKLNEKDLRAKRIFLTKKAKELEPQMNFIPDNWNKILSAGMTEEEVETALTLLTKMAGNAAGYLDKNKGERNETTK